MIKLQIGCMIIILFIAALYFGTKRKKTFSHILFSVSLAAAMLNLTFDMITVYTVNHLDAVPEWVNRSCHIVFFGSMIAEIFIFFLYGMILIYGEETAKRRSRFTTPAVVLAWLMLAALPLEYVQTPEGNYSWGPAVIAIYGILMLCMLFSLYEMLRHWRSMNPKKRFIVALAFAIQLAVMLYQALFPAALISGAGIALVNLALFLTVESPDVLLIERLREEKERADEANEAKS